MERDTRTPDREADLRSPEAAQDLFQRELDGDLSTAELAQLERMVVASPELARERRDWQRLGEHLAASRIQVEAGFSERVLTSLPEAGRARSRAWLWPAALVAAFGGLAVALSGADTGGSTVLTAIGSLGDLLVAVLVAGAGLLGASWQGLRLAVGDAFEAAPAATVGVGLLLLALMALLYRTLRRPAEARAARRRD